MEPVFSLDRAAGRTLTLRARCLLTAYASAIRDRLTLTGCHDYFASEQHPASFSIKYTEFQIYLHQGFSQFQL
jgi:hypothetical protein